MRKFCGIDLDRRQRPPCVASALPRLADEIARFAAARDLPVAPDALRDLWEKLIEDDTDWDLQTYAQLTRAIQTATEYNLPLWGVK